VQTADPQHEVVRAVLQADPGRWAEVERSRRRALRLPPATALAAITGAGASEAAAPLRGLDGIEVAEGADGAVLVRAGDPAALADALTARAHPAAKVRVEVDPVRR
jgi:hypothetical protein